MEVAVAAILHGIAKGLTQLLMRWLVELEARAHRRRCKLEIPVLVAQLEDTEVENDEYLK